MKKMLVALLAVVLAVFAFAGPYTWDEAIICGNKSGTNDTNFVNAPGFSHPYGVAVSGTGRVFTQSYFSTDRYDKAVMVYDPEFAIVDTIGPEITDPDGVPDTLGSGRGLATLANGNIAIGDWTNDRIRVFDADFYDCVAQSPGPDDPVFPNVGGGMAAFEYDGEQYYLSQQIVGSTVILWDETFAVVDTLTGGPGGRNVACTEDGSVILSPTLGGQYLIEWSGNPDDGYVSDTLWLADYDIEIGNVMYVSLGPNGYFWLFSRDAANDGVLVVDPTDDMALRLYTNTDLDSVRTPDQVLPLGMEVDNMGAQWLARGLIDTIDWITPLGYNQAEWLRAPCQVAGGVDDGTYEYVYLADFYGYTLKSYKRLIETSTWEHTGYIGENGFNLNIAYPNPFNPSITIPYDLSADGHVAIDVFDLAGKKVASVVNEYKFAGNYDVVFNAGDLASGNYMVKMTFNNKSVSQKISLVK